MTTDENADQKYQKLSLEFARVGFFNINADKNNVDVVSIIHSTVDINVSVVVMLIPTSVLS